MRSKFSKYTRIIRIVVLLGALSFVLFVYYVKPNSKTVIAKVKFNESELCLTQILSNSESDNPPYGTLVFLDKKNCVADSWFGIKSATQIFGGNCKSLKMKWESAKSVHLSCFIDGSETNIPVKLENLNDIIIKTEIFNTY